VHRSFCGVDDHHCGGVCQRGARPVLLIVHIGVASASIASAAMSLNKYIVSQNSAET
jgi:hypothetical protein